MPAPFLAALRAKTLDDVNRWIANAVTALKPVFELGTSRIQGYDVPAPVQANDGQAVVWNAARQRFVYGAAGVSPTTRIIAGAGLIGGGPLSTDVTIAMANVITAGGPIGSTTTVPVITWNSRGQLTVVGVATIAAGSVPSPTKPGQFIATLDGANWTAQAYANWIDLPPLVPSAIDTEFSSGALPTGWSLESSVSLGTVNALNSVAATTVIADFTTRPGWGLLQCARSANGRGLTRSVAAYFAAHADVIIYGKLTLGSGAVWSTPVGSGINVGNTDLWIADSTITDFVRVGLEAPTASDRLAITYKDSAGNTASVAINTAIATTYRSIPIGPVYVMLRRTFDGSGNSVWNLWGMISSDGGWFNICTFTGPGTLPGHTLNFTPDQMRWTGLIPTGGTSDVFGCKFIRARSDGQMPGGG